MRPLLPLALAAVLPGAATAAPQVVADIAPVQSLVAQVMAGVGEPGLIVPPGVSEHHQSLRPSQSAMLDRAEVVFWVGPELEPWLDKPLAALAGDAQVVELFDSPGTRHLPVRHGATFEAHRHDDGGGDEEAEGEAAADDGHGHEHGSADGVMSAAGAEAAAEADHHHEDEGQAGGVADPADHDHDHGGEHDHDHGGEHGGEHDHDHGGEHDHDHGGEDPHAWLDPVNAQAWLRTIAATLAQADPDNAATYARNAGVAAAELEQLTAELTAELAPVKGTPYVVFHDAYQYFETRFGVPAAGSISLADGAAPGPARLAELRERVGQMRIACALREPQFDPGLIDTVFEGMTVRTGTLDPLGATLEQGPTLYPQLLRQMAKAIGDCAG